MQNENNEFIEKMEAQQAEIEKKKREDAKRVSCVLIPCPCCGELIYLKNKLERA